MADEENIQTPVSRGTSANLQANRSAGAGVAAAPEGEDQTQGGPPKDSLREIVETVVFVIVLVLLLKTFIAEAFVIPTGSMATTLLGHHIDGKCPQCGFGFTVNASNEMEDPDSPQQMVRGCKCPNCHDANQPAAAEPRCHRSDA